MRKMRTYLKYMSIILVNKTRYIKENTTGLVYQHGELLHSSINVNKLCRTQSTTCNNNTTKKLLSSDAAKEIHLKRTDLLYLNTIHQRPQDENTFCFNASRSE